MSGHRWGGDPLADATPPAAIPRAVVGKAVLEGLAQNPDPSVVSTTWKYAPAVPCGEDWEVVALTLNERRGVVQVRLMLRSTRTPAGPEHDQYEELEMPEGMWRILAEHWPFRSV